MASSEPCCKCQLEKDCCSVTLLCSVNVRHVTVYVASQVSVSGLFMTSLRYVGDRAHPLDPKQRLAFPFQALTEGACVSVCMGVNA